MQILTDLIENLAMEFKVTDDHVIQQIDADRGALGLEPLPPPVIEHEIF